MSEPAFKWTVWTEEETFRMADLGGVWDRAEAGDPLAILLRDRIRAAERAMKPTLDAIAEEWFTAGTAHGLALLTESDRESEVSEIGDRLQEPKS